eukprot:TRINITY_DN2327_c3_g1_i1.p1 TRINITY_DN2327_c3_g1~~TRINITY_DN2327_c3_g1_i1.p1  ORF type:complete len:147 (+),score=26.56 TRINITY_DN2327_c3_g1_i1:31-471(+)
MTTALRKNRKKRGHVSAGHGRIGKHRCHPGGRGNAGGMHHHRTLFEKYHPGYFGKKGMRHFHLKKNAAYCKTININELYNLVDEDTKKSVGENQAIEIDCLAAGFHKVLGNGVLPATPLVVKARFFSKAAEAKIVAAGGKVVLARL